MSRQDIDLTALISSRICHDLISPIGAINNGLELLNISGSVAGPEMSLISESVESASARIRFFRIAFGAAGDQQIAHAETVAILRDLYASSRLKVNWQPTTGASRADIRVSFLAILCFETAMPYGGRLEIEQDGVHWRLEGLADKLMIDPALWGLIEGAASTKPLLPAHVQFALLPQICADEGRALQMSQSDTSLKIQF